MDKKFHITDDGPKECRASVQDCPVGGTHYPTEKEAAVAYDDSMKQRLFPKNSRAMERDRVPLARLHELLGKNGEAVVKAIGDAGARPILVGGCVRDAFMGGAASKDIDIEVFGEKENGDALSYKDLKGMFKRVPGAKVQEAGAAFSVLKIRLGEDDFDVSLPRTEMSTGEHHSEYDVSSDSRMGFDEAASRRDFTINSIGYDPIKGELVDPHGGREDLERGVLRHVGPAFSDDPLRCMRAVNFASRFGYTLDPETEKLCRELAPRYSTLSHERVEEEFNKALYKGKHVERGLTMLNDIGWAQEMPAFKNASREQLATYGERLNATPIPLRKAVLAHSMEEDGLGSAVEFLESSSRGRTIMHGFSALAKARGRGEITAAHRALKKRADEVSNEELKGALSQVGRSPEEYDFLPERPHAPALTGKMLSEKGFPPGPEMGRVLRRAQEIQDEENLHDGDELLRRALRG